MAALRVLLITTSHITIGNSSPATGIWLEELAGPYYVFDDDGVQISLASPNGGVIPIDPQSERNEFITDITQRFKQDKNAMSLLSNSIPLSAIESKNFDVIFIVGGHGSMWDLRGNEALNKIIKDFIGLGKPIGAVGSGVVALTTLQNADGTPFVKGKKLTSFSNAEVEMKGLTLMVPFLLETELLSLGAFYSRSANYTTQVVTDGNFVTGQNPASSIDTAKEVLSALNSFKGENSAKDKLTPATLYRKHVMNLDHHVTAEDLINCKVGFQAEDDKEIQKETDAREDEIEGHPRKHNVPNPYSILEG